MKKLMESMKTKNIYILSTQKKKQNKKITALKKCKF